MAKKGVIKKGEWKDPEANKYRTASEAVAELYKQPEPSALERLSLGELIRQIVKSEIKIDNIYQHGTDITKEILKEQKKLDEMYGILNQRESGYGREPRFGK